jgi:hypothetical protein
VRVVGPAGAISWLANGVEVEQQKNADKFVNFNDAQDAADSFVKAARKRWPQPPIAHVYIPEEE